MVQLVKYFHIPDGRNAGIAVAFGTWPTRILKHRGWSNDRLVYERVATPEEHEWLANCMRFQALHYGTVDGLVEDEGNALAQWPHIFASLKARIESLQF